jgi:hypothetical protein
VLTDEQLTGVIRERLVIELSEVTAPSDLLSRVHQRYAKRRLFKRSILGGIAAVVAVAIALPLAATSNPPVTSQPPSSGHSHALLSGPAVSFAGYRTNLPAGYTLARAVASTSCGDWWHPGPAAPRPLSTVAFSTRSNTRGCLGVAIDQAAMATASGLTSGDPLAPAGSQPITIGPYRASVYREPNSPTMSIYVQVKNAKGAYNDLVFGARGIPQADLVAMIRKALPKKGAAPVPSIAPPTSSATP